ncbi:hypothetical protein ACJMK2_035247 [Sinanodonta woodiana]|uniref:Cadherin-related family member 1 n=1 Tax=Sinanodonta woodiana TaxID=1069815 RepID=A0ABD3WU87_SINWO
MGRDDWGSNFVAYMIVIECTGLLFSGCMGNPQFRSEPQYVQFYENTTTQIGTLLFNLTATDSEHPSNTMTIFGNDAQTNMYVSINQTRYKSTVLADVHLKKLLDRESNDGVLELTFFLNDSIGNTILKSVKIYILDECDEPPQYERPSYTLEINEMNITHEKLVFDEIHATDRDNGNYAVFTYTMESKDYWNKIYNETFRMDAADGKLYLLKSLDYENNSFYQFTLYAHDNCGLKAVPASLTIKVKDVQDKPPFFIGLPYMRNIPEGYYNNCQILTVEAFDGDIGIPNKVNYSLVSTNECFENNNNGCAFCSKLFEINSLTGDMTINGSLDWDMQDVLDIYGICNIVVKVTEITEGNINQTGDIQSMTNITVKIVDKNNHSPTFGSKLYTAKIQENARGNTPILLTGNETDINISDKDQGINSKFKVTLLCENDGHCQTFAVVPENAIFREGVVTIRVNNNSRLDYEQRKNMTITVIAMEMNNSSHTDTATVMIEIENVNEFPPVFANGTYVAGVEEGAVSGTNVINITATDNDTDDTVTYSLTGGNNLFSIHNETGQIVTNCDKSQLDREVLPTIYLTVIAKDHGGIMTQAQLIINLKDVNDNPPVFQQKIYSAFLEENSTEYTNKSFLTVKATDADQNGTENSEISYTLGNATWNSNFTIDNTTGEIRLLFPLDYEALNDTDHGVINLTVFATDHGTPESMRGNVTVTILVQDMNDNAPVFMRTNYTGTIKENATSGTFVGMVSANDADKTERNRKTSFAIESGGFDNFRINSTTGNVTVQVDAHFDRDSTSLYNLTIIAIDQGSNSFTATTTMSVTITDVNNKPPKFNQSSYSVPVLENTTKGYKFTSCIATDSDQNHQLNYSIHHTIGWNENGREVNQSDIENYFRIEDGNVYANATLDRETVERLEVTIVVHDIKEEMNAPQTATTTLTVTLLDVNDNNPDFISGISDGDAYYYKTNVSENANNPTILMSVSATDKDKNRTIIYKIINSTLNADFNEIAFNIDSKTGELSKIGPVDREKTSSINLTVIAIDNGYPSRTSSSTVMIAILDFNDNTPQFYEHNDTYSVQENVTNGTIIGNISARDDDQGENAEVEYEIENVQSLPFQINNKTGTISVSGNIDRENVSEYRLTILAKDHPKDTKLQRTNRTSILILVTDVNDNNPKFSGIPLETQTPENMAVKTVIFTVTATDADEGHNANVTFSIENKTNVNDLFDIINTEKNKGQIIIARSLDDSEEWRNITLIATDHGTPPRSSNTTLHIKVLDVNLQAPKLGYVQDPIKVFECASFGTELFRINASDGDKTSPNNEVHFNMSIIQPQNSKDIVINKTTGQVLVAANLSVANISSYKVQVTAIDQGTPNLTSSVKVIDIVVDDVNDQPPRFLSTWFNFTVEEERSNKPINHVVAFDPDKNSNSCYILNDLRGYSKYFTINNTGYILVKEHLDRENESQQIITFEVQVYDCTEVVNVSVQCGKSYQLKYNTSATAKVKITVLDIDDNPPEFTNKHLRAGIRTKSEPGKEILELKSQSYISDKDLPQNAINKWFFEKVSLAMEPKLASVLNGQKTGEVCKETLCVNGNGTIVNNMWYTQDMSGFFNLSVRVNDSAGNDTTYILIFLIADSQVLKMTLLGNRTAISLAKNDILSECSNRTGLAFVYDSIADHITDDGNVESFKTDLFFHIDDPVNNRVLSSEEAKRLLDTYADKLIDVRINRNIISIESSLKSVLPGNESIKTIYVLAAVIGLLALVILIVGYMFFSSSNRYKRKLRAAMPMEKEMNVLKNTVSAVPGSNMYANNVNPLLKAGPEPPKYHEIDATSHNSLDENEVDDAKKELPKYELEEREITLDMYAEDYYSMPTIDPLEAAIREHEAQTKTAMKKQDVSNESVNYGFLNELELETTEI